MCWETSQKAIQVRDNGNLGQGKDEERDKQICKIFRLKLGTLGKEMDGWDAKCRSLVKYNLLPNSE